MRAISATVAVAALVVAVAGAPPGLPACAASCVNNYGGCNPLDYKCICSNTDWLAGVTCCVSKACDTADQDATIKYADALCAGQGITNLPTSATCASTASATGTSMSSSGMATTGTAAATTGSPSSSSASMSTGSGMSSTAMSSAAGSSSAAAATSSTASSQALGNMHKIEGAGVGLAVAGLLAML